MILPVRLEGTGAYLPAEIVSAEELDRRLGVAPGTVLARNGVRKRHFAGPEETASAMAAEAVRRALAAAGLSVESLDAIVFAGVMSEQPMPSTAVLIHRRLGARADGVTCLDVNASCAGFMKGLEMAGAGIACGLWRQVAVVAAELSSKGLRWEDLDTCTLFGDGAAAAIVGAAANGSGILAVRNATYSEGAELSEMRAGGSRFNMRTPPGSADDYLFAMDGRALLRLVRRHFPAFLDELLRHPVDVVIPHQASAAGLALLRKHLAGRAAVVDVLEETGNQVSVSIPYALDCAVRRGQLQRGQTALLVSTAAGVMFSGMVIRY
jgi:3-oxoacyl-[acyl-carrier-protein] synthase III